MPVPSEEVKFVVHPDGKASLYVNNLFMGQVGRCSGIELHDVFNKIMSERNLPYRLNSDYSFVEEMLRAE